MSSNLRSVIWPALTCAAVLYLSTGARTSQAGPTQAQAPTEERMPRAGIDPGGVITGIATRNVGVVER